MDYATAYSRVVNPTRYSREAVDSMLHQMSADPEHRKPGAAMRMVLADALQDQGREEEAQHMRSQYPVSYRDGKVQTSTLKLHRMLTQMRRYYGGEHVMAGEPSELRLEAAKELEKIGRHHEAAILRSNHEINTHSNKHVGLDADKYPNANAHTVTGDYPRYAYGGGEILYPTRDGEGIFCSRCANGENGSRSLHHDLDPETDQQWIVDHNHGMQHEEGPPINCDHCGREIASNYGDPDNPEDE